MAGGIPRTARRRIIAPSIERHHPALPVVAVALRVGPGTPDGGDIAHGIVGTMLHGGIRQGRFYPAAEGVAGEGQPELSLRWPGFGEGRPELYLRMNGVSPR